MPGGSFMVPCLQLSSDAWHERRCTAPSAAYIWYVDHFVDYFKYAIRDPFELRRPSGDSSRFRLQTLEGWRNTHPLLATDAISYILIL